MRKPSPLHTSAFRLALVYTAIFALSGLILLGFIYWTTVPVIDRQADATIDSEILALVEQYQSGGLKALTESIKLRIETLRQEGNIYLLTNPDFTPLIGNLHGWPAVRPNKQGWLEFAIRPTGIKDQTTSIARARAFRLAGGYNLLVGRDLRERRRFRAIIIESLSAAMGVLLVVGLVGGLATGRGLLRRLDVINRTSAEILRGSLDRRVPVSRRGDEFDELAQNLNRMLERIESLMTGMRTVTDNIAHDLRSPLNRLRSRLELAMLNEPVDSPRRQDIEQSIAEIDELLGTFNALLSIAQAEAGTARTALQPLGLADLARDVAELYLPLAEDKGLTLTQDFTAEPIVVGDRHLISQALANLIDNAIKYTKPGGRITIRVTSGTSDANLIVTDTGPGIPEAARTKVLERFVRLDQSRHTPGSGLGLSLAAAVTKLHGGTLRLEDADPGLRVILSLPKQLA